MQHLLNANPVVRNVVNQAQRRQADGGHGVRHADGHGVRHAGGHGVRHVGMGSGMRICINSDTNNTIAHA